MEHSTAKTGGDGQPDMSERESFFQVERGSDRNFGLVFAAFFLIISLLPLFKHGTVLYWALTLAVAFTLIALFKPVWLKPLNLVWFRFGLLLGAIVAPLVMMVIFFLVITPIGLFMRLTGKDPLRLKKQTGENSYWIERTHDEDRAPSMKNQF